MKPVIVQVVQHLRPGGIETMALDLQRQLADRAEIHIVSLEGDSHNTLQQWPRLTEHEGHLHFLGKPPGTSLKTLWRLFRLLRRLKASAVHSHHIGPLLYGGLAARMARIRCLIHTEHDAWHLSTPSRRNLQGRLLNLVRPLIVADCDQVARVLRKHYRYCHPTVIMNGVDVEYFKPCASDAKQRARKQLSIPEDQFIIGCAARLEPVKGHKFLFRALAALPANVSLVLAGDGSQRACLEALASDLGQRERIHFLGAQDDMRIFYHAIDLFCLPSLNEGLPLSPLEAQASGIPAIVTDVGGCSNTVCPVTGALVPPADSETLHRTLLPFCEQSKPVTPRHFVLSAGDLRLTADQYFELLNTRGRIAKC